MYLLGAEVTEIVRITQHVKIESALILALKGTLVLEMQTVE